MLKFAKVLFSHKAMRTRTPTPWLFVATRGNQEGDTLGGPKGEKTSLKDVTQGRNLAAQQVTHNNKSSVTAPITLISKETLSVGLESNMPPSIHVSAVTAPITLISKETLSVGLESNMPPSIKVSGVLELKVNNLLRNGYFTIEVNGGVPGMDFRTDQHMQKTLFRDENILKSRYADGGPFPSTRPLKWTLDSEDECDVPLKISCKTSICEDRTKVKVEYHSGKIFVLQNVDISVPLPPLTLSEPLNVVEPVKGEWRHDLENSKMKWSVPLIDDLNHSGSLEFDVPGAVKSSEFFPVRVKFTTKATYSNLQVRIVPLKKGDAPTEFVHHQELEAGWYELFE